MNTYPHPTIVIDSREQLPLPITGPIVRGTLTSGDYSFLGGEHHFGVERKSLADLVASLTAERDRFERELERLRGYRFARLVESWAYWSARDIVRAAEGIAKAAATAV